MESREINSCINNQLIFNIEKTVFSTSGVKKMNSHTLKIDTKHLYPISPQSKLKID